MTAPPSLFQIECQGATLIVTPQTDLSELLYQKVQEEGAQILARLESTHVRNIVLDLGKVEYSSSTALGFFVRLWKRVRLRKGHMALCNVCAHEAEILHLTRLDGLWPICSSREEAIAVVDKGG